jgi:hypothetical protein
MARCHLATNSRSRHLSKHRQQQRQRQQQAVSWRKRRHLVLPLQLLQAQTWVQQPAPP